MHVRSSDSSVAVLLIAVSLSGCGGGGSHAAAPAPAPPALAAAGLGGSNYGWYHLDAPCSREPYGVVYNYDTATTTINGQLQQMYNNGQRRLRIPIYFARGLNSGTIMDSTGGNLASRFQTNLANLLAAVK